MFTIENTGIMSMNMVVNLLLVAFKIVSMVEIESETARSGREDSLHGSGNATHRIHALFWKSGSLVTFQLIVYIGWIDKRKRVKGKEE